MSYIKPELVEVSLDVKEDIKNFGREYASQCSGSCCYAKGSDW